jgi:hypothetical protein
MAPSVLRALVLDNSSAFPSSSEQWRPNARCVIAGTWSLTKKLTARLKSRTRLDVTTWQSPQALERRVPANSPCCCIDLRRAHARGEEECLLDRCSRQVQYDLSITVQALQGACHASSATRTPCACTVIPRTHQTRPGHLLKKPFSSPCACAIQQPMQQHW